MVIHPKKIAHRSYETDYIASSFMKKHAAKAVLPRYNYIKHRSTTCAIRDGYGTDVGFADRK